MKRDNDLLRQLMLELEADQQAITVIADSMGMPPEERRRLAHVWLLEDAGLVEEVSSSVFRITNAGHDYLEAIRDEGIWSKTKQAVTETGGNATLEILKQLAAGLLKKKISEHTGIDL